MAIGSIAQINEVCTKPPSQEADQSNKQTNTNSQSICMDPYY